MAANRPLDVVVWGASGFTGRLVAEHIVRDYQGKIRWAMAGRNQAKLELLRAELRKTYGKQDVLDVPVVTASLDDPSSLDAICKQTRVVISTAGPFALIGTPVVESAVRSSTHYVDITGEIPWVKTIMDKHHDECAKKGVRIVPCSGYDSTPFDLATYMVADYIKNTLGKPTAKVVNVLLQGQGGWSGGTIASGMNLVKEQKKTKDPDATSVYALVPELDQRGNDKDFWGAEFNADVSKWLGPFVMQVCNNRVVHRSNYFLNYGGKEFKYQEGVATPSWWAAKAVGAATAGIFLAMSQTWLHPLMKKVVPKQGEGPSRDAMLNGFYNHAVLGYTKESDPSIPPTVVIGEVSDPHRDPGYWGTSRMVLEAGLCLALQQKELDGDEGLQHGGVLTPASAMGMYLIERLRAAGIKYEVKEAKPAETVI